MAEKLFRQGEVYWHEDCPPLDGLVSKRRPVIIVDPADQLRRKPVLVVVVAVSSTVLPHEADAIPLPNLRDDPQTTSGLEKPCWAVPRWILQSHKSQLQVRAGYISGKTLVRVLLAVEKHKGETQREGR